MAPRPWQHSEPLPASAPRHTVPPVIDEAGDRGIVYRKPYQQRAWQRSGMRCSDTKMSESTAGSAEHHLTVPETPPRGRRARFSSRNTEPVDKLDMDEVLSVLDRMNFKPSKNKVTTCTPPENVGNAPLVDPSTSVVPCDNNSEQTLASKESFASYSSDIRSVLSCEDETTSSEDDGTVSPLRDLYVCTDVGNTDLARARSADVPHILGTLDAPRRSPDVAGCTNVKNTYLGTTLPRAQSTDAPPILGTVDVPLHSVDVAGCTDVGDMDLVRTPARGRSANIPHIPGSVDVPLRSADVRNADLTMTPPRSQSADVPRIPGTVDAWKSLSSEACMITTLDSDSSSDETSECDAGSVSRDSHILDSTVPDNSLPVSIKALSPSRPLYSPASNNMPLDGVLGRGRSSDARRGALNSSALWIGNPSTPDSAHTPRHLSANASYLLEQEDGDVIIESEEADDDHDHDDDDEDWC